MKIKASKKKRKGAVKRAARHGYYTEGKMAMEAALAKAHQKEAREIMK